MMNILSLPNDVLHTIFGQINSCNRALICTTCKRFSEALIGMINSNPYSCYHAFMRSKEPLNMTKACLYDDLELIKFTAYGTNISTIPESAFHNAFSHGSIPVIEFLLRFIDDHPLLRKYLESSLGCAVMNNHLPVIDIIACVLIIDKHNISDGVYSKITNTIRTHKYNVFIYGCKKASVDTLKYYQSQISIPKSAIETGLHVAVNHGNIDVVKYLAPGVRKLTHSFSLACAINATEIMDHLIHAYPSRIDFNELLLNSYHHGHIIKYANIAGITISQDVIMDVFLDACRHEDAEAKVLVKLLEHKEVIVKGFYILCKLGCSDLLWLFDEYEFTMEQLQNGLNRMTKSLHGRMNGVLLLEKIIDERTAIIK